MNPARARGGLSHLAMGATVSLAVAVFACASDSTRPVGTSPLPTVVPPLHSDANVESQGSGLDASADEAGTLDAAPMSADAGDAGAGALDVPEGMALVPGGMFRMGADKGGEEDEHPAHDVTLAPFFLDLTEVTNESYERCEHDGACPSPNRALPARTRAGTREEFFAKRKPVVSVTWHDASAYCASVGKRLPTEAEFERAVRGDDGRKYPWGNGQPTATITVFGRELGNGSPDEVGSHPEGRGPFGHDDLAGNVWEWMADDYDPYAYRRPSAAIGKPGTCKEILAAQDELRRLGQQGFTGSNPIPRICEKVLRGGAFNYDAFGLRSTNRVHHPSTFHLVMSGFRCAKDAPVP